jgi:hypothetical protein
MSITEALLLLTTALGLAFGIERFLEAVNGLIKRIGLQMGPAAEARSNAVERAFQESRLDAFDAVIEQTSARLAEAMVAPPSSSESDALPDEAADLDAARDYAHAVAQDLAERLDAIDPSTLPASLQARLERLLSDIDALREGRPPREHEAAESYPPITVLLDPVSPPNAEKTAQTFWLQLIGAFAGVVVCFVADFGLFEALQVFQGVPPSLDHVLTGVLIGAGSQPIHVLIKFMDQRGLVDLQAAPVPTAGVAEAAEQSTVKAAPKPEKPVSRIQVPYAGGVDPDLVARRQPTRQAKPDLIVFHHTAMHSDTTFDDVVRVIQEQRGWATAYHCVVLADGSIHPFCRWDYVGNHAKGANFRSIGVTLNGNFETNPSTPGANDRGQFGLRTPPDAQLESAARVTALWCVLYDIPVDFHDYVAPGIVPHKVVKPTVCPGSNFPYQRFENLVRTFHDEWAQDDVAEEEIALFKQKARIYPQAA